VLENQHLEKILVSKLKLTKCLEESKYIWVDEIAYMLWTFSKETSFIQIRAYLHIKATNMLSSMIL
jgi:hypothetical protein